MLTKPSAAQHLDLADWCIRQELWTPAIQEIDTARRRDADNPRIKMLTQRLAMLQTAHKLRNQPEQNGPQIISPNNGVVRASHEQPVEEEKGIKAADYPDGTLEIFTRRIQPLLVNNCTLVGCHREGGDCEFQLSRALLYGESNQRTTRLNFLATLELIDEETPID